ncbi:hypothetical protein IE81DRAFT_159079 [Ceraceosorus guamensis]|uniref:Uncharacterized protein n=1 Tax=Ceraceosorus guamensis TaxID=1522189 RepID=A0A316VWD1_9BASI|nr:hypothetical protein IE81DRAFT_159079 [Ceraceosorus guamensis]PWN41770.1 hypothetical protein IE81DRAFT_159079 [Ceraceosorus guamensis]
MFREQKRKREEEAAANAKKQASNGAEGKVEKKKGDGDDEEGDKTLILDENDDSATDEEEAESARPSKATRAGSADRPTKTSAGPHRAQGDVSIGTNDPVADFRRALQDARDPAVVIRAMCQVSCATQAAANVDRRTSCNLPLTPNCPIFRSSTFMTLSSRHLDPRSAYANWSRRAWRATRTAKLGIR